MSLILPWENPEKWKNISGVNNCIGKDIASEALFDISNCNALHFSREKRTVAFGFELLKKDSEGRPLMWTLRPSGSYRALLPKIIMPFDCYGIISPRSTLSKMGIICPSAAVVDPSFAGHPYMLMFSTLHVEIEPTMELFSMRMYQKDGLAPYVGFYQFSGEEECEDQ